MTSSSPTTTSSSMSVARRAQAGNLKGQIQVGGNPFEGSRSREYPTPPQKQPYGPTLFAKAAAEMGYKPFPQPSGNLSQAYTNPLGVALGPCTYCGLCEWFGVRQLFEGEPTDHDLAGAHPQPQFSSIVPSARSRASIWTTPPARHRRHLCGHLRERMGAAGGPRAAVRVSAIQRAPASALGNRQAL